MMIPVDHSEPERPDPALTPFLDWNAPTDHIELFAGPIGYRSDEFDLTPVPGQIELLLRAGSHLDWAVNLDETESDVRRQWEHLSTTATSGELYFDFLRRVTTVPAYKTAAGRGFIVGGPGRSEPGTRLTRVVAHWVNLPNLGAPTPIRRELGENHYQWWGRWRLSLPTWLVVIDSRNDLDEVYREARRTYQSVLTHTMQICRPANASFTTQDADTLLHGMHLAFSFLLGRWAAPILAVGMDQNDRPAYSTWGAWHVDTPGHDAGRWWPQNRPQDLLDYFIAFLQKWSEPVEQDHLRFLVTAALAAGQNAYVEQRLMTSLAAVEYVSWVDEVLGGLLPEAQWRAKKASQRIRRLLNRARIPTTVDAQRTLALAAFGRNQSLADGPAAVAAVRDGVTHPKDRRILYGDDSPIADASRLSSRYLDLVVLHRIGYQGHTRDRTKITGWEGETDPVPWSAAPRTGS